MRLIYVNSSKVTKLEQKMNNSESCLLLLKNLLKCTYEVLLPSQRYGVGLIKIGHKKHWLELPKVDRGREPLCVCVGGGGMA